MGGKNEKLKAAPRLGNPMGTKSPKVAEGQCVEEGNNIRCDSYGSSGSHDIGNDGNTRIWNGDHSAVGGANDCEIMQSGFSEGTANCQGGDLNVCRQDDCNEAYYFLSSETYTGGAGNSENWNNRGCYLEPIEENTMSTNEATTTASGCSISDSENFEDNEGDDIRSDSSRKIN